MIRRTSPLLLVVATLAACAPSPATGGGPSAAPSAGASPTASTPAGTASPGGTPAVSASAGASATVTNQPAKIGNQVPVQGVKLLIDGVEQPISQTAYYSTTGTLDANRQDYTFGEAVMYNDAFKTNMFLSKPDVAGNYFAKFGLTRGKPGAMPNMNPDGVMLINSSVYRMEGTRQLAWATNVFAAGIATSGDMPTEAGKAVLTIKENADTVDYHVKYLAPGVMTDGTVKVDLMITGLGKYIAP